MGTATVTPNFQGSEQEDQEEQPEVNDGSLAPCEDWDEEDPIADDKELQHVVLEICKHYAGLDKYGRRTEVIDSRRQRFYRRDVQYIVADKATSVFGIWNPSASNNGAPAGDSERYTEVYNIFWPYMRALISVGTQNPPGVDFEPDDPTKGTDVAASRAAETFRHFVDRVNQRKKLQSDVMSFFCTDTRTVLYTRSIKDKQKFGLDDDGEVNSGELISAFGTLESKVQIVAGSISASPYCILSDEPEINMAKEEYPQYAENIKQATSAIGESAYERMARIGVLQGTKVLQNAGDAYAHLTTRHRVWLRPSAYRRATAAQRKQLLDKFPDGIKVVYCGDAYCGSYNQSMDDHISVGWPGPGDGMSKPSMMNSMVALQDAFNDYKNLEKEIFDHCIPVTYRNKELGDIETIREQTSEPGNNVDVMQPAGVNSLADCFYREPDPSCPPALIQAYQDLVGKLAQFISGAQPALFGASDQNNETKGGIAMLRDQAMGQFSIAWGHLQELFASAYKQAVICAAKSRAEDQVLNVKMPAKRGKTVIASVNVSDLKKGNFHAYPDLDSSFPETTGAKRQVVMGMVTQALANPLATEAYGVLEPENLELQRELMGITDWIIPGANSADKQMSEIELLLEQKPTIDMQALKTYALDAKIDMTMAQMNATQGIPAPTPAMPDPTKLYKCSIPVDIEWDFHSFEYETIKSWLSSPDGIEEAKTNQFGVLNVKLHGMQHKSALAIGAGPQPGAATPPAAGPIVPGKPPASGPVMPPPQAGAMNAPVPA